VAGLDVGAGDEHGEGRRLGHAQAGAHDDALADFRFLHLVQQSQIGCASAAPE
jgi:hypothetical protein